MLNSSKTSFETKLHPKIEQVFKIIFPEQSTLLTCSEIECQSENCTIHNPGGVDYGFSDPRCKCISYWVNKYYKIQPEDVKLNVSTFLSGQVYVESVRLASSQRASDFGEDSFWKTFR